MNSFFITFTLAAERHFLAINNKKKIKGVDQGTLTDIIRSDQLDRITIVQFHFGFAVTFRVN
jgi:hypothetical protein